jgi:hypothetical protein
VTVPGRTNVGANKIFYLNLTNAVGAGLLNSQAAGTITNNNSGGGNSGGSTSGGGECAVTSQWVVTYDNGAAFDATQTLTNPNSTNITIITFDFDGPYSNIEWINSTNAGWVAPVHSGTHFSVTNGWPSPAVIPAGGALQFTYQGSPGGSPPAPSNLAINGTTIGQCGGNNTLVRFTGVQRQGNDIVLSWSAPSGKTNWVQVAATLAGGTSNWTDLSGPIIPGGAGNTNASWSHTGATTTSIQTFYRIRVQSN